jgi:cytochrome c-type biogenesis protein
MVGSGQTHTFWHALAFVFGFSAVFVVLGASVAFVGYALNFLLPLIAQIGGTVLIIFGLQVAGAWSALADRLGPHRSNAWAESFLWFEEHLAALLYTEGRVHVHSNRRWGYLSSALMGVFFSAGWIPCVGPVLAAIYLLAGDSATVGKGALLLAVYSAGLGIPFLLTGAAFASMTARLRALNRHMNLVSLITGIFLIAIGIVLVLDRMPLITGLIVGRMGTGLASLDLGTRSSSITLPIAFVAGLLSFLSPCVLPLIPAYIGYLSGTAASTPANSQVSRT